MIRADRRRRDKEAKHQAELLARREVAIAAQRKRSQILAREAEERRQPEGGRVAPFLRSWLRGMWSMEVAPMMWIMRGAARLIGVDADKGTKAGRGRDRS
jgi:hypothetical protein